MLTTAGLTLQQRRAAVLSVAEWFDGLAVAERRSYFDNSTNRSVETPVGTRYCVARRLNGQLVLCVWESHAAFLGQQKPIGMAYYNKTFNRTAIHATPVQ